MSWLNSSRLMFNRLASSSSLDELMIASDSLTEPQRKTAVMALAKSKFQLLCLQMHTLYSTLMNHKSRQHALILQPA